MHYYVNFVYLSYFRHYAIFVSARYSLFGLYNRLVSNIVIFGRKSPLYKSENSQYNHKQRKIFVISEVFFYEK